MRVLIIANARFKGGISGSDAIYENFHRHWGVDTVVSEMIDIDYKPFWLCYIHRILDGIYMALFDSLKYDVVYSSSDFLPDVIPAVIHKLRGRKWVAGFYLKAFKDNPIHYHTQKIVKWLINKYADMVIVTNPTMYDVFPDKKRTWINGGIDLSKSKQSSNKIYDAVFCGRIHPSKGIDEMIEIWKKVREKKKYATLAVIGDGDLGKEYIKRKIPLESGIHLFGYMEDQRFDIYSQSKMTLYPTPPRYDHYSMAPVEAMSCGCPMLSFNIDTVNALNPVAFRADNINQFVDNILMLIENYHMFSNDAIKYAQKYSYKEESLRVLNEIRKVLSI